MSRSMYGTRLSSALSGFLPPLPPSSMLRRSWLSPSQMLELKRPTLPPPFIACWCADDEVHDLHRDLVDVVEQRLGLAVEHGEDRAAPTIPVPRPKAVQFMASEMPWASRVAFIDGSTPATPAKDLMRPVMVPRRPRSVARLPSMAR